MLTEEAATRVAQDLVSETQRKLGKELLLQRAPRFDSDRIWAFSYNTVAFRESRHPKDSLVGNGPIVVDRYTGAAHRVPTGGMKDWLEQYHRTNGVFAGSTD